MKAWVDAIVTAATLGSDSSTMTDSVAVRPALISSSKPWGMTNRILIWPSSIICFPSSCVPTIFVIEKSWLLSSSFMTMWDVSVLS